MDEVRARRLLDREMDRILDVRSIERERWSGETEGGTFAELSSMDQHQADAGSETFQAEVDATIIAMEDERLADVVHALRRLGAGTYGTCETCGAAIPDERRLEDQA